MVDLKKEEAYAYLMVESITDEMGLNIHNDVIPLKSEKDVKKAMLNIIGNNIQNSRDNIRNISYDGAGSSSYFTCAKIEYKSFKSKTYKGIRRKVHEVK